MRVRDHPRVAVVSHGYYPRIGGIERQRAAVTALLRRRGYDPAVVCRRDPGTVPFQLIGGVPVHRITVGRNRALGSLVFSVAALARVAWLRPDIIQAHQFLSTSRVGLLGKRILRVPLIVIAHRSGPIGDVQLYGSRRSSRRRVRHLVARADALVGVSEEICNELRDLGVDPARIHLIRNGIDGERFRRRSGDERVAIRTSLGLPPSAVVVTYVGRLAPEKRVPDLVAAFTALPSGLDAHLVIAGDGPERQALADHCAGRDNIHLLGSVDDVAPLLGASDVFVLCSVAEGLSNAVLEACASELAVVLTDVGAARDVVTDGQEGVLVRPCDDGQLAAQLRRVVEDAGLRNRLGAAARDRVVRDFGLEDTVGAFVKLYDEVLGR